MKLLNKIKDILSSNNADNAVDISVNKIKEFNRKFNAPFGKPYANGNENTILSKHCFLSTDTVKTKVNNNVFVLGGSESDWVASIVQPNMLQMNGSYIIVDPEGKLKKATSKYFKENGYKVNVFDPENPNGSSKYNPLAYVKNKQDVLSMATILSSSLSLKKDGKNDLFLHAYTLLISVIFYLLHYYENDSERVKNLFKIFENAETDIATTISLLDKVLGHSGNADCQKFYSDFKKAPSEIIRETVEAVARKLAAFPINLKEMLLLNDEIHLNKLADAPTVTYIITKSKDISYNVAASVIISQAYDAMIENIGSKEDSHFTHKMRFILPGEYILTIPDFRMKIIAARKYGLSFMIYVQSLENIMKQDTKIYPYEDMVSWLSSFDTLVFLGGKDSISIEYVNKKMNAEQFTTHNNFTRQEHRLLAKEEIRNIQDGYCLVLIRGNLPFYDQKYDPAAN